MDLRPSLSLMTSVVVLVLFGMACGRQQAAFAQTSASGRLIGAWLGPTPGDAGRCGKSPGTYVFTQGGRYTFQSLSEHCGSFTLNGNYRVQNDTIDFQQTGGSPGTHCCDDLSVRYRFADPNTLSLEDQPGHWLNYFRQR